MREENSLALPGGSLEARIEFGGFTRYLLRTGDVHLFMNDDDSVKYLKARWPPQS